MERYRQTENDQLRPKERLEQDTLGSFLRKRREELGLKREAAGVFSGLGQPYIGKLERGDIKDPGFSKICRLAKVYRIDINELSEKFGVGDEELVIRGEIRRIHEENPDNPLISAIESGPGLEKVFAELSLPQLRGYLNLIEILKLEKDQRG